MKYKAPYILGLDIETTKIPNHLPWKENSCLVCLSISRPDSTTKTWFFNHNELGITRCVSGKFREIFAEIFKADFIACHNAKFELNWLRDYLRIPPSKIFCTQVAEYLITYHSNRNLDLSSVSQKYGLPAKIDKVKILWDSGYETTEVPVSTLIEYCEDDATKARVIAGKQYYTMLRMGLFKCFSLQMEWLDILSEMESNGIWFDQIKAKDIINKYNKYLSIIDRAVNKFTLSVCGGHELNLSSNDDLSVLLYGGTLIRRELRPVIRTKNVKVQIPYIFTYKDGSKKIKLKWKNHPDTKIIRTVYKDVPYKVAGLGLKPLSKSATAKSNDDRPYYKTDKDTLSQLELNSVIQKRVVNLLIKRSAIAKVISTFYNEDKDTGLLSKISPLGKLHTNYNQTVTATGRLSSSDPNSQNLPRGNTSPIKKCFVPGLDGIMNADVSQMELRVPAQLAGDVEMIREFVNDEDLHANGCTKVMELPLNKENRFHAKRLNFRMIYGGTEYGYFKDPTMPSFSLGKWGNIIKKWFAKYNGIKAWQDANIQHVIDGDGTLQMFTGRIFKFKRGKWDKYDERKIKNYPVQGPAGGDFLPLAAVIIRKKMRSKNMKSKMLLTVHDSIVFDYKESEKYDLAKLCIDTFEKLPKYIKQYWGYDWVVPIKGEVEIGSNYGELRRYM